MKKRLLGIVSACLLAGAVQAEAPVEVKGSAPERYTVVSGDTLWGIAGRYLNDPWRWPEVWEANRQVSNPHLIYPGDILLLCTIKGRAVVAVDQGGGCAELAERMGTLAATGGSQKITGSGNDFKLHPQARSQPLSLAIPAIPLGEIQRFLNDSRVVQKSDLDRAPYVLSGTDSRLILGAGDKLYVRNRNKLLEQDGSYGVYRGGYRYVDPDTNEVLGYEAEDIGAGKIVALAGEVGTFEVSRTTQEVRIEDKLLPNESQRVSSVFYPSNPEGVKPGKVLRIFNSIGSGAQYSVVVLNRGDIDGVRQGHTFALYKKGTTVRDRVTNEYIKLPAERSGLAMVFRTFPRVSYALVLRTTTTVKVGDEVRPPISGD
ncbi:MAG: LysM peptidoglycan-binding domain-containing protein [Moraxellaceae bacterium]|nr:LysM peptidoglycan-binding domain-containing protein [Moraxellaceae bacterium]